MNDKTEESRKEALYRSWSAALDAAQNEASIAPWDEDGEIIRNATRDAAIEAAGCAIGDVQLDAAVDAAVNAARDKKWDTQWYEIWKAEMNSALKSATAHPIDSPR